MAAKQHPIVIQEVADPDELAKGRAQDERFERNLRWFTLHAADIRDNDLIRDLELMRYAQERGVTLVSVQPVSRRPGYRRSAKRTELTTDARFLVNPPPRC